MRTCNIEGCDRKHSYGGLCEKHAANRWYHKNKEQVNERVRKKRKENPEYRENLNKQKREEYFRNKAKHQESGKKWRQNNKDKISKKHKAWVVKNKQKLRDYHGEYYLKNKEVLTKRTKVYKKNNIEKVRFWAREKARKNMKNPLFRLSVNISSLLYKSLKGNKDYRRWESLVGYTLEDLRIHLERYFDDKISWNNYGAYWVVDHIIPLYCYLDSSEEILLKYGWALKNLRPLEKIENIKKQHKLILI